VRGPHGGGLDAGSAGACLCLFDARQARRHTVTAARRTRRHAVREEDGTTWSAIPRPGIWGPAGTWFCAPDEPQTHRACRPHLKTAAAKPHQERARRPSQRPHPSAAGTRDLPSSCCSGVNPLTRWVTTLKCEEPHCLADLHGWVAIAWQAAETSPGGARVAGGDVCR
jgi:hypothetical protein